MRNSFSKLFLTTNLFFVSQLFAAERTVSSLDNFSNAPVVTVGGFVNTLSAFRNQDGAFDQDRLPDAKVDGSGITDSTYPGTHNTMNSNPDFTNESEVHIKAAGINEFGMKYGAIIELEADASTAMLNQGFNADKTFIFTESRSGKFEFGNNIGVNQKMSVGPSVFARAAGGINGRYLQYINLPMLADSTQLNVSQIGSCGGFKVNSSGEVQTDSNCNQIKLPSFILIPTSPIRHGGYARSFYDSQKSNSLSQYYTSETGFNVNRSNIRDGAFGDLEDATKINYYSPRIGGWQLGVSYTPDTGNSGTSAIISGNNSGDVENLISWGVNYSSNFGNLGLALSATGENGKYEQSSTTTIKREDLKSYDFGVMATYFGFTLGGSYGIWGNSLMPTSGIYSCNYDASVALGSQNCNASNYSSGVSKFGDANYYTAGVAYEFGPVAASVTHISSQFQDNNYKATSFGIDYRMARGLMPYLEVTQYKFESNQPKASDITDQATLSNSQRQLKDNDGFVVLVGLLFSF